MSLVQIYSMQHRKLVKINFIIKTTSAPSNNDEFVSDENNSQANNNRSENFHTNKYKQSSR